MLLLLFELKFVHHFSPKTRCDCSHKHHLCNCVCYTSGRRWSVKIAIVCGACFPFHLLPQMINDRKWLLTKFNNYSAIGKFNITFWSSLSSTTLFQIWRIALCGQSGMENLLLPFCSLEVSCTQFTLNMSFVMSCWTTVLLYTMWREKVVWVDDVYCVWKYSMIYYTGRAWDLSYKNNPEKTAANIECHLPILRHYIAAVTLL